MKNYTLQDKDVAQGIVIPQEYVLREHLEVINDKQIGDGIFTLSTQELEKLGLNAKERKLIRPFYTTENIGRYFASKDNERWIIYTNTETIKNIDEYPKIKKHLLQFEDIITSDFGPFGLHRARDEKFFLGQKVICARKTFLPAFSYVDFPCYVTQTFFVLQPNDVDLKYLVAVLNSKLIHFWLYFKGKKEGNQLQIDKAPLLEIPIRIAEKPQQFQLVKLVDKMYSLTSKLVNSNNVQRDKIIKDMKETESSIDQLVLEIYKITGPEEQVIDDALGELTHPEPK